MFCPAAGMSLFYKISYVLSQTLIFAAGLALVVIILWLYIDCSAWLPCPDTEFGEEDKPIRRQTSQSYDEVSCGFCASQQGADPV